MTKENNAQKPSRKAVAPASDCSAVGCKDDSCSHSSDCAVHNEPAYPAGPCDCGATALVRHCDRCLAVTAIDLDNTPANAKALSLRGQSVRVMDADEAKGTKIERCKC